LNVKYIKLNVKYNISLSMIFLSDIDIRYLHITRM
jgi:hypothetical protein